MEDPSGIFTLWLDFGDTFFIMNFNFLFFFSHGQMSVIQKHLIAVPVIFKKTWKKTHGGFGTQFPLIFFITGGSLRSQW